MISKIARGAYLLILAAMVAAYALSPAKSEAPKPHSEPPTWTIFV
jgi:hypothetical protein